MSSHSVRNILSIGDFGLIPSPNMNLVVEDKIHSKQRPHPKPDVLILPLDTPAQAKLIQELRSQSYFNGVKIVGCTLGLDYEFVLAQLFSASGIDGIAVAGEISAVVDGLYLERKSSPIVVSPVENDDQKISELHKEISELKSENDGLRLDIDKISTALSAAKELHEELNKTRAELYAMQEAQAASDTGVDIQQIQDELAGKIAEFDALQQTHTEATNQVILLTEARERDKKENQEQFQKLKRALQQIEQQRQNLESNLNEQRAINKARTVESGEESLSFQQTIESQQENIESLREALANQTNIANESNGEIERLKEQQSQMATELDNTKGQLDETQRQLEAQSIEHNEQIEQQNVVIERCSAELEAEKAKYEELLSVSETQSQQIEQGRLEQGELVADLERLNEQIINFEERIQAHKSEIESHVESYQQLEGQNEALQNNTSDLEEQLKQVKLQEAEQKTQYESTLAELRGSLLETETALHAVNNYVEVLTEAGNQAEAQEALLKENIDQLTIENTALISEKSDLEQKVSDALNVSTDLEHRLEESQSALSVKEASLVERAALIEQQNEALQNLQSQQARLTQENQEQIHQITQLNSELDEAKSSQETLSESLASMTSARDDALHQVQEHIQTSNELRNTEERLTTQITSLSNEKQDLINQSARLNTKLMAAEESQNAAYNKQTELTSELHEMKLKLQEQVFLSQAALQKENLSFQQEKSELTSQIESQEEALNLKSEELTELKSTLTRAKEELTEREATYTLALAEQEGQKEKVEEALVLLQKNYADLESSHQEQSAQLTALNETLHALEQSQANYIEAANNAQVELQEQKQSLVDTLSSLSALDATLSEERAAHTLSKEELTRLQSKVLEQEQKLNSAEQRLEMQASNEGEQDSILSALQQKNNELENTIRENQLSASARESELQSQCDSLQSTLEAAQRDIERQEEQSAQVSIIQEQVTQLSDTNDKLMRAISLLKQQNASLKDDLAQAQAASTAEESAVNIEASEAHAQLLVECEQLRLALSTTEQENERLTSEVSSLSNSISQSENWMQQRNELLLEIDSLRRDNQLAQQRLSEVSVESSASVNSQMDPSWLIDYREVASKSERKWSNVEQLINRASGRLLSIGERAPKLKNQMDQLLRVLQQVQQGGRQVVEAHNEFSQNNPQTRQE